MAVRFSNLPSLSACATNCRRWVLLLEEKCSEGGSAIHVYKNGLKHASARERHFPDYSSYLKGKFAEVMEGLARFYIIAILERVIGTI